jgi:nucleoside-diphosphate-sugar epimerase/sugar phosphate isomerase/epimerase
MSTGSGAIPQLKAAPLADQLVERLDGGPWAGLELALLPPDVADEAAMARAIETTLAATAHRGLALTAEAPVSWPSGAFVRVDRLTDEARVCIQRSAEFAAAIGSPVLTIHLYAPLSPDEFRARPPLDEAAVQRFLGFYADACLSRGVQPLVENVPPALRMRVGGLYFSEVGGHWRDLLRARELVPELRFTFDTSHAGLFRSFAAAYPSLFGLASDTELELERYADELGPHVDVVHVSDAHGLLGEGLPYGAGELDLDPVVARLARSARFLVAEINEPDPARSPAMKSAYRAIERAAALTAERQEPPARRLEPDPFDWQAVVGQRDPVPSLLELQERYGGRRILLTGGAGSIGSALTTLLAGFRPAEITVLDAHEAALTADRRRRGRGVRHVLCDLRESRRVEQELGLARPDIVFHLAAYKHVDWAELYPEEFVDTNLHGSWNVLTAAERTGVETVVVASTDKAALAASFYGRTKRFMEQLTAFAGRRAGGRRIAIRFVNVLGTAGSASELFLRQARARVPLTVTDSAMVRYWITMAHAAAAAAQAPLLADEGVRLATPADAVTLTVGELAERIWRASGRRGDPFVDVVGIRPGETLSEVLTGPGEELGEARRQGIAPILGEMPTAGAAWVVERLPETGSREEARAVWLEAMRRPGLLARTAPEAERATGQIRPPSA